VKIALKSRGRGQRYNTNRNKDFKTLTTSVYLTHMKASFTMLTTLHNDPYPLSRDLLIGGRALGSQSDEQIAKDCSFTMHKCNAVDGNTSYLFIAA